MILSLGFVLHILVLFAAHIYEELPQFYETFLLLSSTKVSTCLQMYFSYDNVNDIEYLQSQGCDTMTIIESFEKAPIDNIISALESHADKIIFFEFYEHSKTGLKRCYLVGQLIAIER